MKPSVTGTTVAAMPFFVHDNHANCLMADGHASPLIRRCGMGECNRWAFDMNYQQTTIR